MIPLFNIFLITAFCFFLIIYSNYEIFYQKYITRQMWFNYECTDLKKKYFIGPSNKLKVIDNKKKRILGSMRGK